ncbi:MAG: adenylate/guanylate cyclase domain-containing protein [Azospirillaceae bacterium]
MLDVPPILHDAERDAQRLSAWLRIGIAVILGVAELLLLPGSTDAFNMLVVGALASYLALSVLSLFLASGRFFRPWHGKALSLADGLWLGIITYAAMTIVGAGFGEAALLPPALLLFVMLALAAMRYTPTHVIVTTLAFFAGIAGSYWLKSEGMMPRPTSPDPELIALMTGPEATAARVLIVLITAGLLAFAVMRARKTLITAIEQAAQRANLSRTLPPAVAERVALEGADGLATGEVRHVAVLFADIRGFSRQVESLPPAQVAAHLTEFRRMVITCVERHGGIVDKFIGDGAMAVFGSVGDGPCGAAEALAAAGDLVAMADAHVRSRDRVGAIRLRVGVGVHAGPALVGAIGDRDRLEFTVLGDTVNVAAHLEALTKPHGTPILASQDCLEEAGIDLAGLDGAGWRQLPETVVAGRRRALTLVRLATTRYDWTPETRDGEETPMKALAGQVS